MRFFFYLFFYFGASGIKIYGAGENYKFSARVGESEIRERRSREAVFVIAGGRVC